jgi:hypothetical protein
VTPTMGVVVVVADRRQLDLPSRSLVLCRAVLLGWVDGLRLTWHRLIERSEAMPQRPCPRTVASVVGSALGGWLACVL